MQSLGFISIRIDSCCVRFLHIGAGSQRKTEPKFIQSIADHWKYLLKVPPLHFHICRCTYVRFQAALLPLQVTSTAAIGVFQYVEQLKACGKLPECAASASTMAIYANVTCLTCQLSNANRNHFLTIPQ